MMLMSKIPFVIYLLYCVAHTSGDIIKELMIRYEVTEKEVRSVVSLVKKRKLLDTWLERLNVPKPALIVIDMQNDFITGSLAVEGAIDIIPKVKEVMADDIWHKIVLSQDWHPQNHISFFSNLRQRKLDPKWLASRKSAGAGNISMFDEVKFATASGKPYTQILWPDHCVQGSEGAKLHPDIEVPTDALLIQKGTNPEVDSYSAFYDNTDKPQSGDTGLADRLKRAHVSEVVIIGLATDFCVGSTAIHAEGAGFPTTVLEDASRGVSPTSTKAMLSRLEGAGAKVTTYDKWRRDLDTWDRAKHLAETMVNSAVQSTVAVSLIVAVVMVNLFTSRVTTLHF